jgi:hypothetical protein
MKTVRTVLVLVLVLAVASPLLAKGKKGKGKAKNPSEIAKVLKLLQGLDLTTEQQGKIDALKSEFKPKIGDVKRKLANILTPEQKQAKKDAQKAAKAAGKKGKQARQEIAAAVKLTDQQKTQTADANKELKSLAKDFRSKVMAVLTPEQQAKVKAAHPGKKGRGRKS